VAPSLSVNGRGYSLLGETTKYVTASAQRFTSISISENGNSVTLTATMVGSPSENVQLQVVNPSGIVENYKCVLSGDGAASLECIDQQNKIPVCICKH
jgi:peptidoglycan hydrolase-like protein with peptidoglycan-binding domain